MSGALLIGAFLAALLGCVCLALSQDRHWKEVVESTRARSPVCPVVGWLLVGASLAMAIVRDGASFAVLFWPMLLGFGAFAAAVILALRPRAIRPLALIFRGK